MSLRLHDNFWSDSFNAIESYVYRKNIEFPMDVHFFSDNPRHPKSLAINKQCFLDRSRNKVTMNKIFDRIKVPHPKTYYLPNGKLKRFCKNMLFPKTYIRKQIKSYGGNGKKIYPKLPDFDPEVYYLQDFYKHLEHYRLYWLDGPILWAEFKGGNGLIRNSKNGWKYCHKPSRELIDKWSIDAVYSSRLIQHNFGLQMFAADIACVNSTEYRFLEINSMPRITQDWRLKPFVEKLVKICKLKEQKLSILKN